MYDKGKVPTGKCEIPYISLYESHRQSKYKGHKRCQQHSRNDVEVSIKTWTTEKRKFTFHTDVRFLEIIRKSTSSFCTAWTTPPMQHEVPGWWFRPPGVTTTLSRSVRNHHGWLLLTWINFNLNQWLSVVRKHLSTLKFQWCSHWSEWINTFIQHLSLLVITYLTWH